VYVDEAAAVFVRTSGNEAALARATAIRGEWDARTAAWLSRPAKKWPYPAGRIEGTRAYGRFLGKIGRTEEAVQAYLTLANLNISEDEEVERRLLVARYYAASGRTTETIEQVNRILEIDPENAAARALLR
jgi:tetratricopeptide (TPR) repeat protein